MSTVNSYIKLWPPWPIIGPRGPLPPTPGIMDPMGFWLRLDASGRFHLVTEEARLALEQEIKEKIADLLEQETMAPSSPQFHLALADYFSASGLIFQQLEALGAAVLLDRDPPVQATCETLAGALSAIGSYDYAAAWYQYLAETATDVASAIDCVERQVVCLQKYVSALRTVQHEGVQAP